MENNTTDNEYLKTKVLTAPPEQLQLMLYDGCIRFCRQGREAIQNVQIERSHHFITRAENILLEMANSMRQDLAPEACGNMRKLYMFCYDRLVTANLKKQIEPIDEALKVLYDLRETWVMLLEKLKQENVAGSDASVPGSAESSLRTSAPVSELEELQIGATVNLQG